MDYLTFNSKQLNPNQFNPYYNLPINTQNQNNQNIAFSNLPNQTIYTQNISIQNHIYNYQGQTIGTNYKNNNYFGNNQGNIGNNFKSKIIVHPIFGQANEKPKKAIPFTYKSDSENKIKIIFKNRYDETEKESKRNVKFEEVAMSPSNPYSLFSEIISFPYCKKYIFNGKIIDKNKTLAELGIYNNSEILEVSGDIQNLLIIDQSPLRNGNNSENENQTIYFYFILDLENSTKYKMLIQSKKVRNLWEVFLYFNKKIGVKIFNIISFISLVKYRPATILNHMKSLDKLGIENDNEIFILIKQNIWIVDENPLITQEDYGNKFISKEQMNIIKIFLYYFDRIIIIQCSKERKLKEIVLYLEALDKKKNIDFIFDSKILNKDETLSELGIKNGNIIHVQKKEKDLLPRGDLSIAYILEDKNKKKEIKYIAIKFIKNGETYKFICKSDQKFKEISLKYMKETGAIKQYNFYFNGKIIFDENKTLFELNIESFSEIIVTDGIKLINLHNKNKIEKKEKYDLNILYYDENLLNKENSDNCCFLSMNMNGTFYGCHYFELFKIVCEKIKRNKNQFILITSGSCAQKIFNYCSNINEIREYLIFCFDEEKYKPLMNIYPKLKGIYSNFYNLIGILYFLSPIKMNNISSSNLIFFEDYSRIYIKLHYEFIQKYSLYKLLKSYNCNVTSFLDFVEKNHPYFLDLAKQLFPDKKEIINYFKNNIDLSKEKSCTKETLNEVFNNDDILKDNIKTYVKNYTKESFYYKYLNKFLREGNFEVFRILSNHLAKFIFKLYEYREKNIANQTNSKLFRKMYLEPKDIKLYQQSIGKVICYPAFTSTSLNNKFIPKKWNDIHELVCLEIEQNNTKAVVSISKDSKFKEEEEYLFLPFSFFKIVYVKLGKGNVNEPHIIYLKALNSDKPIEEIFADFMKSETDSLDPEGLDLLVLTNNSETIAFNQAYISKIKKLNIFK